MSILIHIEGDFLFKKQRMFAPDYNDNSELAGLRLAYGSFWKSQNAWMKTF